MKNLIDPLTLFAASMAAFMTGTGRAETLDKGDPVPDITAQDDSGKSVNLAAEAKRGWTLIYFYPKADTPGCTKQGCNLRDNYSDLVSKGVKVFGVSADTVEAQRKFKEKFNFPFSLIADKEGKVIDAFGVEKLPIGMSKRVSFLSKDGLIVWRDLKPKPDEQSAAVYAAMESLAGKNP